MTLLIDFSVIAVLIVGIRRFRRPRDARMGNLLAAFALLAAFVLVLYRNGVVDAGTVVAALLAGAIIGYAMARAVNMIQIPAMVAFQNGAGGAAAFLVSFVELTRNVQGLDAVSGISGVLGLTIGSLTFSGSMVASAKLAGKMRQTPKIWPAHQTLLFLNLAALLAAGGAAFHAPANMAHYLYIVQILLAAAFGILFSVRVGGADMPVLISFLNATSGLAAAFCGIVVDNRLLIAFGATVAASGSILTHVMCKAMNRHIARVIWPSVKDRTASPERRPIADPPAARTTPREPAAVDLEDDFTAAADIVQKARNVIIIPGYGMALAKAQENVAALAKAMMAMGKEVKYAIHPVAGRMPGHMNVLLAEAGVDYDMLVEMEDVNPDFPTTDLALVVGACDVVNPAAIDTEGTPISGMPVLMAHKARHVICCNFDKNPGYSGVPNPLYEDEKTILMLGDAKDSTDAILSSLKSMGVIEDGQKSIEADA